MTIFNFWSSHHKNSREEIEKDLSNPVRHNMSGTGSEVDVEGNGGGNDRNSDK